MINKKKTLKNQSSAEFYTKNLKNRASLNGGVTVDRSVAIDRIRNSSIGLGRDILKNETKNLLKFSEDFSNAIYIEETPQITIVSNSTTSPIGTSNATKITENTSSSQQNIYQSRTVIPGTYTLSIYAKAGERNFMRMSMSDFVSNQAYVVFDILNGTISTAANITGNVTNQSASITSVGSGWFRCTLTCTVISTSLYSFTYIRSTNSTAAYAGTSGNGIYIWGMQLEQNSIATQYQRTQDFLEHNASYVYNPSTYGEGKTYSVYPKLNNLLLWSEDITKLWSSDVPITTFVSNVIANPIDGSITADKVTENTSSSIQDIYHYITTSSGVITTTNTGIFTFSVYLKAAERSFATIQLATVNPSLKRCMFMVDLSSGVVALPMSTVGDITKTSISVVSAGNGWYRCSATGDINSIGNVVGIVHIRRGTSDSYFNNYAGVSGNGIYIFGGQLEQGSVATPYQKTTSIQLDSDLTFTRATSATVTNKDGSIGDSCYNFVPNSEDFINATWVKQNTTITSNITTNYLGVSTASKLVENTTNGPHNIYVVRSGSNETVTLSIYAKAAERNWLRLGLANNVASDTNVTFNLSTGTVGTIYFAGADYSGTTASIQDKGNGWYRCTITSNKASINTNNYPSILVQLSDSTAGYIGTAGSGIYIWGAQLTQGSTLRDYLKTTNRLNVPRIDYSLDLTKPSLLIEPVATNLIFQSETFDNTVWQKFATTVSPNTILAPNGTMTADSLFETSANALHELDLGGTGSGTVTSGQVYTASIYVKPNGRDRIGLHLDTAGFTVGQVYFELSTLSIVAQSGSISGSIVNAGNGWVRLSVTQTANATGAFARLDIACVLSGTTVSYTGDVTKGYYIWGAQCELGSIATTYIPTTTAAVTRNAETSFVDLTNNSLLNQNNFTLYGEGYLYNGATTDGMIYLGNSTTTAASNDSIGVYNQITPQFYTGGAYTNSGLDMGATGYFKFAIQRNGTNINFFRNGALIWTQTVPIFNYRYLCINNGGSTYAVRKIELYRETLSDTSLINKTT